MFIKGQRRITGCAVAPALRTAAVLTAIFDPPQNRHINRSPKKFVTGDYVSDPYGFSKLGAYIRQRGASDKHMGAI